MSTIDILHESTQNEYLLTGTEQPNTLILIMMYLLVYKELCPYCPQLKSLQHSSNGRLVN